MNITDKLLEQLETANVRLESVNDYLSSLEAYLESFAKHLKIKKTKPKPLSSCPVCGEYFNIIHSPNKRRDRIYCSDACKAKAYRQRKKQEAKQNETS